MMIIREMTIDDVTVEQLAERQYEIGQTLPMGAAVGTPQGPVLDYLALRAVVDLFVEAPGATVVCHYCQRPIQATTWRWHPAYRCLTHYGCPPDGTETGR